jgi:hypothetical protein
MKKLSYLLILCNLAILVLNSCNPDSFGQVVTFDIPKEAPKMVCTANFSDKDTTLSVYLSLTLGTNEKSYSDKMDKATVKMYKDNVLFANFLDVEQYFGGVQNTAQYTTNLSTPLTDGEYKLNITYPPYLPIEAKMTMPSKVAIKTGKLTKQAFTLSDGNKLNELVIDFDDPSVLNYYQVKVSYELQSKNGNTVFMSPYQLTTSTSGDGPGSDQDRNILFNDASFNGKSYKLRLGMSDSNQFGSEFKEVAVNVLLISMTKDAFLFEKSLAEYYRSQDNPFGSEPSQVNTNFTNGYGLFQVTRTSKKRILL